MRLALAIVVAFLVLTAPSAADEASPRTYIQTPAPRELCKPDDANPALKVCRAIPPGRFLDEASWLEMDAKLRVLEDTRTRLTAENGKLRSDMGGWSPGWKTLLVTFVVGAAGGVYAYHRLD